jgi:glycerol uptake facilitator-like aquaporin
MDLPRRLAAELLGTAFLLCTVVGSGIMGEQLAGGNVAIALLANTLATGAVLVALILTLGGISSHFNPVVTLADAYRGGVGWREVPLYVVAQVVGALIGVIAANLMFGQAAISLSTHARTGGNLWLSEFIATFGLILTVFACDCYRKASVPFAVGAYITAAYWFTSSTSFANPAVTFARAFSNSFAGIRLLDVPMYVALQVIGAMTAALFLGWLLKPSKDSAHQTH